MSTSLLNHHLVVLPRHFMILLLSIVFSIWGHTLYAQGHPALNSDDFTVTFVLGSENCDTEGVFRVVYANRVAGFTKLTYKLKVYDTLKGEDFTFTASTTEVGKPFLIEIPGVKSPELRGVDIHVEAEYGGATPEETDLYYSEYWSGNSYVESTSIPVSGTVGGGGACATLGGEITLPGSPVTGVRELTYRIYSEDGSLLNTYTLANPYLSETIRGLAPKSYKVQATAVMDCDSPVKSPDPTTEGHWEGNKFVYNMQDVALVGGWEVEANVETIAVGGCGGNVTLSTSGTAGVTSMTYEIRDPYNNNKLVKTVNSSVPSTFEAKVALLAGSYIVTAITHCGTKATKEFYVGGYYAGIEDLSLPKGKYFHPGCPEGVISTKLKGTIPSNIDITYQLFLNGVVQQTKTVKGNDEVNFEGVVLPIQGWKYVYEVEAFACGKSLDEKRKSITLEKLDFPTVTINQKKSPTKLCTADGSIEIVKSYGDFTNLQGQLEVYSNGVSLYTESIDKNWVSSVVTGLNAGEVKVRIVWGCGEPYEQKIVLAPEGFKSYSFNLELLQMMISYCADRQYRILPAINVRAESNAPTGLEKQVLEDFKNGTYELYRDGVLYASGVYADIPEGGIPIPPTAAKYSMQLRSSCEPTVIISSNNTLAVKKTELEFIRFRAVSSVGCTPSGTITFQVDLKNTYDDFLAYDGYFSYEITKDGVPYRNGKITEYSYEHSLGELPVGHYNITVFVTCAPELRVSQTFEISGDLVTPAIHNAKISPICGSQKSNFNVGLPMPSGTNRVKVLLTNKSDGTVFLDRESTESTIDIDLPIGEYTLLYTPIGDCPFPQGSYDFKITPPISDQIYYIEVSAGASDPLKPNGVIGLQLKDKLNKNALTLSEFVTFTVVAEDGTTYKRTVLASNPLKFNDLPSGLYQITATFLEQNCGATNSVFIPVAGIYGRVYPDMNCKNQTPLGLAIVMNPDKYDFSGKALTFKVNKRTAPGASTFTTVASKTEEVGKTWTYFPNVLDEENYDLFYTSVEMDGKMVYNETVTKPTYVGGNITATATETQRINNVDKKLGTITTVLSPSSYYKEYTLPFSGIWTLRATNNYTKETFEKTITTPLESVTLDNLPWGQYRVSYFYANESCREREVAYTTVQVNRSQFSLLTSTTDATCELNAQITAAVRDVAGIKLLTYSLTGGQNNSYSATQSTTTPEVPMVFSGLGAGKYTLKAEGLVKAGERPLKVEREITINSTSPPMNIIFDPTVSRPSFKNCATGYFSFRFDDLYSSKEIDDNYKFTIVEAPAGSGITVPMELELNNPFAGRNASRRMDFPAGKYKLQVRNLCKLLELEATLPEYDENPTINGIISYLCGKDGKYRISEGRYDYKYNQYRLYWDDVLRISITPTSGTPIPSQPISKLVGTELPFTPQTYVTRISTTCPSIPIVEHENIYNVKYEHRQSCDGVSISGDKSTNCAPRTLVIEDLDAPVGQQEVYRALFNSYYYHSGNNNLRLRILDHNNQVLWTETVTAFPKGTHTWTSTYTSCSNVAQVSTYIYGGGCSEPAYFKIYKGIGAAKQAQPVYESAKLEEIARYVGPPSQEYTFEAYDRNRRLISSITGKAAKADATLIREFDILNACNYNEGYDGSYRLEYLRFKLPPLEPGTSYYKFPQTTFKFVKGERTFIADIAETTVESNVQPTSVGEWGVVRLSNWKMVHYGITRVYSLDYLKYEFGETITATYSVCQGAEKNITGIAQPNGRVNVELESGWKQTCDGWELKVPNKASYTDKMGVKREVTITGYDYTHPTTRVRYQSSTIDNAILPVPNGTRFYILLEGLPCGYKSEKVPTRKQHTVEKAKSISYFCTASGVGKHYIEATNGTPPYTYLFFSGTGDNATPVPNTATFPNPQTSQKGVTFDYGSENQTYRIDIKDACGNLTITHEATVLNMANLLQQFKQDGTACAGETTTLEGISFPVATYNWTLPAGSLRTLTPAERGKRALTLDNVLPSDAGTYTLDISPNDCATNIRMLFTLHVDEIVQPTTPPVHLTICKGNPVTLSPGLTSGVSNGVPGVVDYQWYQSKDGNVFLKLPNETNENYIYPAVKKEKRYFKRVDTYKGCTKETAVSSIEVNETPEQKFTTKELTLISRHGKKFTLPVGTVNPMVGITYQWERSNDGVSGWMPVGTDHQFEETTIFPHAQKEVFYRRIVTLGNCSVTSPNIRVRLVSSTPMINPHLRLRVKK